MKRLPLSCVLLLLMAACNTPPEKLEMVVSDISFYYIPEVNLGVGVYSNETEQTVRVFDKPEEVTEQRVDFQHSTGITFRKASGMVLSLTDFYRFPVILLVSGYDETSLIEVRPRWSYVVFGKTTQSFPNGVRFADVSLPVGNDMLFYFNSAGQRREIHSVPQDTLRVWMADKQDTRTYAQPRDFSTLPVFFDNNDPEADLDSQLTLHPRKRYFEYRGTTVKTSPNIHRQGWFLFREEWLDSRGFYINPRVPRYVFTHPDDHFSVLGDVPVVVSDIVGMVVEEEKMDNNYLRLRHPIEPWVWIDWKDKNTLEFRHLPLKQR